VWTWALALALHNEKETSCRDAATGIQRRYAVWNERDEQQALVLGLAGVVIGALIGAALPPTERELIGEARDAAMAKASEAGRDVTEQVKGEANDLKDQIQDQASRADDRADHPDQRADI
jgi:surface antigen